MLRISFLSLIIGIVAASIPGVANAQSSRPAFEVASIKPSSPDDRSGSFITMQGGHQFVVKNYSLRRLVAAAHNVWLGAVIGGPSWIDADLFDILAATPGERRPNLEEQMLMLQKLLTDRFMLSFHQQQKELPVYELTVAKEGAKLTASTASSEDNPVLTNQVFPDHVRLPARNVTIRQFTWMLQRALLDHPVIDNTGLSGRYDFDLEWTPDDTQFQGKLPKMPETSQQPGFFCNSSAATQAEDGVNERAGRSAGHRQHRGADGELMLRNVTTVLAALLIAIAPGADAQSSRLSFDVASIQVSDNQSVGHIGTIYTVPGGRFTANSVLLRVLSVFKPTEN